MGGGKDRGRESEAGAASRERDAVGAGRNRARDNIREGAVSGTEGSEHLTAPEAPRLILGAKTYDASLGDRGAGGKGHPGSVAGNHGSGGAGTRKPNVCKFVTERFRFVGGGGALKLLSENTDFTVIAAIGLAGCGKSALMNELANSGARGPVEGGGLPRKPFAIQTEEIALDASHQTVGVDLMVTEDRVFLLDCQPLLSSSVVLDMLLEGEPSPTSYQHSMVSQSYRLLMFILAVSHVVLAISDEPSAAPDRHILALLRAARWMNASGETASGREGESGAGDTQHAAHATLLQGARGAGAEAQGGPVAGDGRTPAVVFVSNMVPDPMLSALHACRAQQLIVSYLASTDLIGTDGVRVRPLDGTADAANGHEDKCNLFLLPLDTPGEGWQSSRPSFRVYMNLLVQQVCFIWSKELRHKHTHTNTHTQVLSLERRSAFAPGITERDWCVHPVHACHRVSERMCVRMHM